VGIHPHHAARFDGAALEEIRALAREPRVVAIGEIGLDFHYADSAPADVQTRAFLAQLDLASELGKPAVIHDRDAHRALMDLLRARVRPGSGWQGMLHCFSGDLAMAREAIALGYRISFAGNITFPSARDSAHVAGALSLDHIVIETDAPYLSPAPRRGGRNEPAHVAHIAAKLAALQGVGPDTVAERTTHNSADLFGLRTVE
jgi:TatD DNase family protein